MAQKPAAVSATRSFKTVLLDESFAEPVLPAKWSNVIGSAWTPTMGGLISPSDASPADLQLGRYYATTRRTHTMTFTVVTPGIFGLGALRSAAEISGGTQTIVGTDCTNLVIFNGQFFTGYAASVAVSVPLVHPLVAGKTYTMILNTNEHEITVTLVDGEDQTVAHYGDNVNAPEDIAAGLLEDYPILYASNYGQMIVNHFTIESDISNPEVMFMGDSITWGSFLSTGQRWATLAADQLHATYTVSARPGGTSTGLLASVQSELKYLRPKYLVFMIGTNDSQSGVSTAEYAANVQAAIDEARRFGAKVIVGYVVPINNPNIQAVVNSYNAAISQMHGVYGFARFDKALSPDGQFHPEFYVGDGIHPNAAGDALMAARLLANVPTLGWAVRARAEE